MPVELAGPPGAPAAVAVDPGIVPGSLYVTSDGTVWAGWNTTYVTAATMTLTTGGITCGNWPFTSSTAGVNTTVTGGWIAWNTAYEETCEQREARERQAAEYQAQADERRRVREAADARAGELLLSLLTEEQAATWREHGWFEVRGSRGGRWRIRNRGQSGNVDLMPEIGEERDASYCAHPPGSLPDPDAYVAQMLHLVTDEDGFKRTANLHYRRRAAG